MDEDADGEGIYGGRRSAYGVIPGNGVEFLPLLKSEILGMEAIA